MSQQNHGHLRPSFQEEFLARKMGELVSRALRFTHKGEGSPVKKISKITGIAPDSVKRWYTSKKPPTIGHFLMLSKHYPEVLKAFLEMSGHAYLTAYVRSTTTANDETRMPISTEVFRDIPNVPKKDFNERQAWFLIRLQSARSARAEDIADHFKVALKTARRDIEGLKMAEKIEFVGTRRTGNYEIIDK